MPEKLIVTLFFLLNKSTQNYVYSNMLRDLISSYYLIKIMLQPIEQAVIIILEAHQTPYLVAFISAVCTAFTAQYFDCIYCHHTETDRMILRQFLAIGCRSIIFTFLCFFRSKKKQKNHGACKIHKTHRTARLLQIHLYNYSVFSLASHALLPMRTLINFRSKFFFFNR